MRFLRNWDLIFMFFFLSFNCEVKYNKKIRIMLLLGILILIFSFPLLFFTFFRSLHCQLNCVYYWINRNKKSCSLLNASIHSIYLHSHTEFKWFKAMSSYEISFFFNFAFCLENLEVFSSWYMRCNIDTVSINYNCMFS